MFVVRNEHSMLEVSSGLMAATPPPYGIASEEGAGTIPVLGWIGEGVICKIGWSRRALFHKMLLALYRVVG
jgi:hypothetical protein